MKLFDVKPEVLLDSWSFSLFKNASLDYESICFFNGV